MSLNEEFISAAIVLTSPDCDDVQSIPARGNICITVRHWICNKSGHASAITIYSGNLFIYCVCPVCHCLLFVLLFTVVHRNQPLWNTQKLRESKCYFLENIFTKAALGKGEIFVCLVIGKEDFFDNSYIQRPRTRSALWAAPGLQSFWTWMLTPAEAQTSCLNPTLSNSAWWRTKIRQSGLKRGCGGEVMKGNCWSQTQSCNSK